MFWILVFSCPKMTLITIFTRMTPHALDCKNPDGHDEDGEGGSSLSSVKCEENGDMMLMVMRIIIIIIIL